MGATPDNLVLDVGMPELSGIEVLERVLDDQDLASRLGCILITGLPLAGRRSLPRDRLAHLPIPVVTLSKPLDLHALKRAISRVACQVGGG
jgi:CheY-like chemotaxis protein